MYMHPKYRVRRDGTHSQLSQALHFARAVPVLPAADRSLTTMSQARYLPVITMASTTCRVARPTGGGGMKKEKKKEAKKKGGEGG